METNEPPNLGVTGATGENLNLGSKKSASFDIVNSIVALLEPLPADEQRHILQVVSLWLHPTEAPRVTTQVGKALVLHEGGPSVEYPFAGRTPIGPKEFMLEKDPKTDAERLTCIAYYLTHFRNLPYFKTEDLSKLNIEAAQPRFTNAAFTAKNAVRDGFLVPAPKQGLRQLSALGEQFVQALPDHDKAKAIRARMRPRNSRSRSASETATGQRDDESESQ